MVRGGLQVCVCVYQEQEQELSLSSARSTQAFRIFFILRVRCPMQMPFNCCGGTVCEPLAQATYYILFLQEFFFL